MNLAKGICQFIFSGTVNFEKQKKEDSSADIGSDSGEGEGAVLGRVPRGDEV